MWFRLDTDFWLKNLTFFLEFPTARSSSSMDRFGWDFSSSQLVPVVVCSCVGFCDIHLSKYDNLVLFIFTMPASLKQSSLLTWICQKLTKLPRNTEKSCPELKSHRGCGRKISEDAMVLEIILWNPSFCVWSSRAQRIWGGAPEEPHWAVTEPQPKIKIIKNEPKILKWAS